MHLCSIVESYSQYSNTMLVPWLIWEAFRFYIRRTRVSDLEHLRYSRWVKVRAREICDQRFAHYPRDIAHRVLSCIIFSLDIQIGDTDLLDEIVPSYEIPEWIDTQGMIRECSQEFGIHIDANTLSAICISELIEYVSMRVNQSSEVAK